MTFQRYESRPITRLAHQITERDHVVSAGEGRLRLITPEGEKFSFAHHEPVNTGDYVVYLNDEDIYHCRREVFLERNIVPEDVALSDEEASS